MESPSISYLYPVATGINEWDLYGYSRTSLPFNTEWRLSVSASLDNQFEGWQGPTVTNSVEVGVSGITVFTPGLYQLVGDHQAEDECSYETYELGQTWAGVWLDSMKPTSEDSTGVSTQDVAGKFSVTINPLTTDYFGQTVRENTTMSDSCWFPGSDIPRVPELARRRQLVGVIGDIAMPWASYHWLRGGGCGYGGSQTMSMDGLGDYETHGLGVALGVTHVTAYRGNGSIQIW